MRGSWTDGWQDAKGQMKNKIDEAYEEYERAIKAWEPVRHIFEVVEKAYSKTFEEREKLAAEVTRTYSEYNRLIQEDRKNRNYETQCSKEDGAK